MIDKTKLEELQNYLSAFAPTYHFQKRNNNDGDYIVWRDTPISIVHADDVTFSINLQINVSYTCMDHSTFKYLDFIKYISDKYSTDTPVIDYQEEEDTVIVSLGFVL